MAYEEFFPSPISQEKKYERYEFDVETLEKYLKSEIVRPTWNHQNVDTLYGSCRVTERWKNMDPDQSMAFCKCGRIALQNINRKYGNGMDIAAYHFNGLKINTERKGYSWDSGL